jgi:hypothetical protein
MNTPIPKRLSPALFALLLTAAPAVAQFEGVLDMKLTMDMRGGGGSGGGTMKVAVAKAGTRCEMNMQMGPMAMKMVMLQMSSTPNTLYRISDADKTYAEMDLAKMRAMSGQQPDARKYTVEKLGQETILGYKTQHVLVKEKTAQGADAITTEMWTAKDLLDYATFSKMQARPGKAAGEEALVKALQDAGADGIPLKSIASSPDGTKMTMEVVKVEKKSLPVSTFEIPAGYTKSEGGLMEMMGGMAGPQGDEAKGKMEDAQQKMQDALKNMSPEQREMIEKMMKQQKAPNR